MYTTPLMPEQANGYLSNAQPVVLEGEEYVTFFYDSAQEDLQEFLLTVYGTCMLILQLMRRTKSAY